MKPLCLCFTPSHTQEINQMPYDFGSGPFDRRMKVPCSPKVAREVVYTHRRSGWLGDPNAEREGGGFGRREEDDSMAIWDGKRWRLEREANAILKAGVVCGTEACSKAEDARIEKLLKVLLVLLSQ